MTIDWSDPAAHNRLIQRVGTDEYNRLHAEWMARSTVATVNGHEIRKVQSRFGKLYQVGRTGTAFSVEAAKNFAPALSDPDSPQGSYCRRRQRPRRDQPQDRRDAGRERRGAGRGAC
jgi:hypothetical protein